MQGVPGNGPLPPPHPLTSHPLTPQLHTPHKPPSRQVNTEIVAIQRVITPAGEAQLKGLISDHAAKTGSARAKALLANWEVEKGKFWQLVPPAEKVGPWVAGSLASVGGECGLLAVTACWDWPSAPCPSFRSSSPSLLIPPHPSRPQNTAEANPAVQAAPAPEAVKVAASA